MREPPKIEFEAATAIGIGMTDKYEAVGSASEITLTAGYHLRQAYEHSLAAFYTDGPIYKKLVIEAMTDAAAILGFDLVPRLTAAECHKQAIARRVAEDDR